MGKLADIIKNSSITGDNIAHFVAKPADFIELIRLDIDLAVRYSKSFNAEHLASLANGIFFADIVSIKDERPTDKAKPCQVTLDEITKTKREGISKGQFEYMFTTVNHLLRYSLDSDTRIELNHKHSFRYYYNYKGSAIASVEENNYGKLLGRYYDENALIAVYAWGDLANKRPDLIATIIKNLAQAAAPGSVKGQYQGRAFEFLALRQDYVAITALFNAVDNVNAIYGVGSFMHDKSNRCVIEKLIKELPASSVAVDAIFSRLSTIAAADKNKFKTLLEYISCDLYALLLTKDTAKAERLFLMAPAIVAKQYPASTTERANAAPAQAVTFVDDSGFCSLDHYVVSTDYDPKVEEDDSPPDYYEGIPSAPPPTNNNANTGSSLYPVLAAYANTTASAPSPEVVREQERELQAKACSSNTNDGQAVVTASVAPAPGLHNDLLLDFNRQVEEDGQRADSPPLSQPEPGQESRRRTQAQG